ncbi:hypothetical protein HK100_010431 [Physocladia obscura]|uniref:Protein-lysine N-methyltransferase EFM5 n=1 Tax=Physocladia obscura TaxID=109957 RepID=A0AAD5XDU1_9FUNG|nr:hypothetical protein HK100_010431 [Physocladia obscura]
MANYLSSQDSDSDSDDAIVLPADTLALVRLVLVCCHVVTGKLLQLQSFLAEKDEQEQRFNAIKIDAHTAADAAAAVRRIEVTMADFAEDWQLSQFWYDDQTARHLATHALAATPTSGSLACVSSPTVFVEIMVGKSLCLGIPYASLPESVHPYVFEFDRRFSVFGDAFVFFDFNNPVSFSHPHNLNHQFDTLVVDPPFLSDDCWSKTSECVRWLAKNHKCNIIVCTGLVMKDKILNELDCRLTSFEPKHKGGLSNEFGCFTNFESDGFKWVRDSKST